MSIGCNKIKIGSCKSAGDYSELPWINRHMSISEWELLTAYYFIFRLPMWFNFTCLITACCFFCRWSDHERNICCHHLVYEIVKSFESLKHLCCCAMDHVFCYILHWVLWNNLISCFLKFIFGKVLLFLVDYMTIKALCQKL